MRRTAFLIVLLVLLVPAAALAAKSVAGDGSLSVRNGDGTVRLDLDRGVVIGRIGAAKPGLILYGPKDVTCSTALVWDDRVQISGVVRLLKLDGTDIEGCVYSGVDLRFRLVGADAATIRISGHDISLSAVGRGRGQIKGKPDVKQTLTDESLADGTWSLNGEDFVSLPDEGRAFQLATVVPPVE
jgi:hypothetical protein